MTNEERTEYQVRIEKLFPTGWFGAKQVKIGLRALRKLAKEGWLEASSARSMTYFKLAKRA